MSNDTGSPAATGSGSTVMVHAVAFGKLVQKPNGPVVTGAEHTITSYARDLPRDVSDLCRPDLLVPADANPLHMVETWAQTRGALFIVPVLRPRTAQVSSQSRHWCIAGRIRPYTERGIGQGGRPATLVTAWAQAASVWVQAAAQLVPAMATHLAAEPELGTSPAAERFARAPAAVPVAPLQALTVSEIPPAALVMLENLRTGTPTRWSKATFADEQLFLECLGVVYRLIPMLDPLTNPRAFPRALLSAASGLAIGSESFLVSYVRDGGATEADSAPMPAAWKKWREQRPNELVDDVLARATKGAAFHPTQEAGSGHRFSHLGTDGNADDIQDLADALQYYQDPGYVPQLRKNLTAGRPAPAQGQWDTPPFRPITEYPEDAPTQRVQPQNFFPTAGFAAPRRNPRIQPTNDEIAPTQPPGGLQSRLSRAQAVQPVSRRNLNQQEQNLVNIVSDALGRHENGVALHPSDVVELCEAAWHLSQPPAQPLLLDVMGPIEAQLSPDWCRRLTVLGALYSDLLEEAVQPIILTDIGPLLSLLLPARSLTGPGTDLVQQFRERLLARARAFILAMPVLDDQEMTLIVGTLHGSELAPQKLRQMLDPNDRTAFGLFEKLMDRSLTLWAWRSGARDWSEIASAERTPAQRAMTYAFAWRQDNFARNAVILTADLAYDALLGLIERAAFGFPPRTAVADLQPFIPPIAAKRWIEKLDEQIAAHALSPQRDAVTQRQVDDFFRDMKKLLHSRR